MTTTPAKRILLISAIAGPLGNLESGNLGNYAIVEPLIQRLHAAFPGAEIRTTLQFTDAFCNEQGVTSLRDPRFFTYGRETGQETVKDIMRALLWRISHRLSLRAAGWFLRKSALLTEIVNAGLVIDWSGDVYGDNASRARFLEHSAELGLAITLGRPVAIVASSPGPFSSKWRRVVARWLFRRVDLVTNREPASTELLHSSGIDDRNVQTTACPAFLFGSAPKDRVLRILKDEQLPIKEERQRPLAAVILSGWNMPLPPYNAVPRKPEELEPFVYLIEQLVENLGVHVVVMSHQNAGCDHAIIQQLLGLVGPRLRGTLVTTLHGLYDTREMKGLLGEFDLVLSGRVHGAIAAISQGVPTTMIEYGNGPRAHKVRGFAELVGLEEYVVPPTDGHLMVDAAERCWRNREAIVHCLSTRIPQVLREAERNFSLLEELMDRRAEAR